MARKGIGSKVKVQGRPELDQFMKYLAWMSRLGLDERRATQANRERDALLRGLSASNIHIAFNGTKPYCDRLSPGCWTCGEGTWSCLFLNRLCTANCFFCPQDRSRREERPPTAEEIAFPDATAYVEYLRRFGFRGAGISGGETLLAFDRLLAFVKTIRQGLGSALHLWLYTNGDLVDIVKLAALREAGLDEIRLNISARQYDLRAVVQARRFIDIVTVEIPVLPEDQGIVQERLLDISRIGVDHLNLHQLVATQHNYERLAQRGYTLLRPLAFHEPPVLESEMAALRLVQEAADRGLQVAVHYCSHAYKARFQTLARRRRGALQARAGFERITDAGYIRRLSVRDKPQQLKEWTDSLRERGVDQRLWSMDETGQELHIDPALRRYIPLQDHSLTVRYFEAHIVSQNLLGARGLAPVAAVELAPGQRVLVGKRLVAERELGALEIRPYALLALEHDGAQPQPASQGPPSDAATHPPAAAGADLASLVRLEYSGEGFPAIPTAGRQIL